MGKIESDLDCQNRIRIIGLQAPGSDGEPLRRSDGLQLLFTQTLAATSSEIVIDDTDVPNLADYKHLMVAIECKATATGSLRLTVNGDNTATNYNSSVYGIGNTYTAANENAGAISYCIANQLTTALAYLNLAFNTLTWDSSGSYYISATQRATVICPGLKNGTTTSITSVRTTPQSGVFSIDSEMRLYGVPN